MVDGWQRGRDYGWMDWDVWTSYSGSLGQTGVGQNELSGILFIIFLFFFKQRGRNVTHTQYGCTLRTFSYVKEASHKTQTLHDLTCVRSPEGSNSWRQKTGADCQGLRWTRV